MTESDARVTIHMATSLDGYVARRDGSVDWLETADEYAAGETMTPEFIDSFLDSIDCYVMGSKTYETARGFEEQGLGWPYGDKPTYVLTSRPLASDRASVSFHEGDLQTFFDDTLRPAYGAIWVVGGGMVAGECLRRGLADEVYYSIAPVLIGDGISFFDRLDEDVSLHLEEVKAYRTGSVELRYSVK